MKKLFLKFILSLAIVGIFACSNDNDSINSVDEDSIAKSLTFKKINFDSNAITSNKASNRICIVSWDEWGRASRDCDGWGLCNALWFECEDLGEPTERGKYSSPLYFNEITSKHYIEIILGEPTTIAPENLTLKIDKSFELNTKSVLGKNLIFKEGGYLFNEKLGPYGGIRIYLD